MHAKDETDLGLSGTLHTMQNHHEHPKSLLNVGALNIRKRVWGFPYSSCSIIDAQTLF